MRHLLAVAVLLAACGGEEAGVGPPAQPVSECPCLELNQICMAARCEQAFPREYEIRVLAARAPMVERGWDPTPEQMGDGGPEPDLFVALMIDPQRGLPEEVFRTEPVQDSFEIDPALIPSVVLMLTGSDALSPWLFDEDPEGDQPVRRDCGRYPMDMVGPGTAGTEEPPSFTCGCHREEAGCLTVQITPL